MKRTLGIGLSLVFALALSEAGAHESGGHGSGFVLQSNFGTMTGVGVGVGAGVGYRPHTSFGYKPQSGLLGPGARLQLSPSFNYALYGITPVDPSCDLSLTMNPFAWSISQIFNQQRCFTGRSTGGKGVVEVERNNLLKDSGVCSCLKSHPANQEAWKVLNKKATDKGQLFLDEVERNIEKKHKEIDQNYVSMMLQASTLAGGKKEEAMDMAQQYTQTFEGGQKLIEQSREIIRSQVITKMQKEYGDKTGSSKRVNEMMKKIHEPHPADQVLEEMEKEAEKNPCLPIQQYMAKKQFPVDEDFYKGLEATGGKFQSKEWDYDMLLADYDRLAETYNKAMNDPSKGDEAEAANLKMNQIKSRLLFLRHNPLLKNFMSAKGSEIPKYSTKELNVKKEELFNILFSSLKETPECKMYGKKDSGKNCPSVQRKRREYNESMKDFFSKDDIRFITRNKAAADLVEEYKGTDRCLEVLRPDVPTTQSALIIKFNDKFPKLSTAYCEGDQIKDMKACVEAFTQYCPMVDAALEKIEKGDVEKPSTDLEKLLKNETSLDPKENQAYKKEYQQKCVEERVAEDGSTSTFPEFQAKSCTKDNGAACYARFIRKFKSPTISEDREREEQDALMDSEVADEAQTAAITSEDARVLQSRASSAKDSGFMAPDMYSKPNSQALKELAKVDPVSQDAKASLSPADDGTGTFTAATSSTYSAPVTLPKDEAKKLVETEKKKKAETEEEITTVKKDLDKLPAGQSQERTELEARIKALEALLSKQDARIAEYQKIASGPSKEELDKESGKSAKSTSGPGSKGDSNKEDDDDTGSSSEDKGGASRAPASFSASGTSSGGSAGTSGGGTSAGAASVNTGSKGTSAASSRMNDALLEKYGISVRSDAQGSILVASASEAKDLPILQKSDAGSIQVPVSKEQYGLFKKNDLQSLEQIYEEKLKTLSDSIVKITITDGVNEPLQFYAIKENGKVIFQPLRKAKLKDLNNTLKQ